MTQLPTAEAMLTRLEDSIPTDMMQAIKNTTQPRECMAHGCIAEDSERIVQIHMVPTNTSGDQSSIGVQNH